MADGAPPLGNEPHNYRVIAGQGVLVQLSRQLASPNMVLPWLFRAAGGGTLIAALLLPVSKLGSLLAIVAAPKLMGPNASRRLFMAGGTAVLGLCYLALALLGGDSNAAMLAVVFVLASAAIGAGGGLSGVAFQDLLGRTLPRRSRSSLLFLTGAAGGGLAVAFALYSYWQGRGDGASGGGQRMLMWLSAGACLTAALIALWVREPAAELPRRGDALGPGRLTLELNRGLAQRFRTTIQEPWFRRYMVERLLLLSVELAIPFYTLYYASTHPDAGAALGIFVMTTSGAMLLGPLWRKLAARRVRSVLSLGAGCCAAAGIIGIGFSFFPDLLAGTPAVRAVWVPAVLFGLVSLGVQGVNSGRRLYLLEMAPARHATHYVSVSDSLIGLLEIGAAGLVGWLAQLGSIWPAVGLIALNLVAVLYPALLERPLHSSDAIKIPEELRAETQAIDVRPS